MSALLISLVAGAFIAGAALHVWRRYLYPSTPSLPSNVDDTLSELLEELSDYLRDHAPAIHDALEPGLAAADISAIERKAGFRLSSELRVLYQWHNGIRSERSLDFIPGHAFRPLAELAEERDALRRELAQLPAVQRTAHFIFAGHRTRWLGIMVDGSGDVYFYDPGRRGKCALFFCFAETGDYLFFPSLANFVAGILECFRTGVYVVRRQGVRLDEDHEASEVLWQKYGTSWSAGG